MGAFSGCSSDSGFSLVEATVAAAVFGIVVIGIAGAMTMAAGVAGSARQRSAATAVAVERMERVRNLDYSEVALHEQPEHSSDPESPDHAVSQDGTSYDTGSGLETLVVELSDGALRHIEDPVLAGPSEMFVHQYVTWVDDPGLYGDQNYKRLTLVVTWRRPLNQAVTSQVTMSTLIGRGDVTVPQVTPPPGAPDPMGGPAPSPTPAPASCDGDVTAPTGSLSILSGAGAATGFTNSLAVQVRLEAQDTCPAVHAEMSNDGTSYTDVAEIAPGAAETVSWSIQPGDGTKTVWTRFRDGAGNTSPPYTASIVLDQTTPTVPGNLRQASCSISGSDRIVVLTWDPSSGANLSGYRLYRSIEGTSFEPVKTTSTQQVADTTLKNHDSVRYLVRAYDKAANQSESSNVKTYTKHDC